MKKLNWTQLYRVSIDADSAIAWVCWAALIGMIWGISK